MLGNKPNRQGWKQFLLGRSKMLEALDRAKELDSSRRVKTYRGCVAEAQFREWLSEFLPARYGVTSGYVISQGLSSSVMTPHFDVIIYDKLNSPTLWMDDNPDDSQAGKSRAIPAEHVHAIIEVKTSLTSRSASEAMSHIGQLGLMIQSIDDPKDRYPKYLPKSFFWATVFFEAKTDALKSKRVAENLVANPQLRSYFGSLILRGEGRPSNETCFIARLLMDQPYPTGTEPTPKSGLEAGLTPTKTFEGGLHFALLPSWSEVNFSKFAFDLLALLNGTYLSGRLSSFHGFGRAAWEDA